MTMSARANGGRSGQGRNLYHQQVTSRFYLPWSFRTREEEKRQCARRSLRCELALVNAQTNDEGAPHSIPGECMNFSEGGLYAIVPIGFGVAMGQRYTFQLKIGECGPEPGSSHIVQQQGEITRTELLLGEGGSPDRVGIAVKFRGHRIGTVPMPRLFPV
jgi:hypothetical protein